MAFSPEGSDVLRQPNTAVRFLAAAALVLAATGVLARPDPDEITITDAWARATAPGQPVAAAYATLKAGAKLELVGIETPAAGRGEIHEMSMEGGVMRMRALPKLALPKGKVVKLAPGGIHIMLFRLAKPLTAGESVPMTFVFQRAGGQQTRQTIDVPVKEVEKPAGDHDHH